MQLSEVADALGATLHGDGSLTIVRAVHPSEAGTAEDLALAMDPALLALLPESRARAAVVREGAEVPEGAVDGYIVVGRSRFAMAQLTSLFDRPLHIETGIHPSAVVAEEAMIGEGVSIGALAYVGPQAAIGDGTVIMPQVTIGAEARIGSRGLLHPGVRIGERVVLGDRVILHHNASIGADGFSFVTPEPGSVESAKAHGRVDATNDQIVRINSLGTVLIGDDVEIGACTAIDRGTISATRIGRGTKIDDLVMIGHNVEIGENCMICGQVGVAGSSRIGNRVVLAGQVGVADHLTIGDDVVVGGGAGVASNLKGKSVYLGTPAMPKNEFAKQLLMVRRLELMLNDIMDMKKRLNAIESSLEKR